MACVCTLYCTSDRRTPSHKRLERATRLRLSARPASLVRVHYESCGDMQLTRAWFVPARGAGGRSGAQHCTAHVILTAHLAAQARLAGTSHADSQPGAAPAAPPPARPVPCNLLSLVRAAAGSCCGPRASAEVMTSTAIPCGACHARACTERPSLCARPACSGRLVCWTKGFDVTDGIGHDPVQCLQGALRSLGWAGRVSALVNDAVAVLGAARYKDPDTCISVILGTGALLGARHARLLLDRPCLHCRPCLNC
jgi:Hexokinase